MIKYKWFNPPKDVTSESYTGRIVIVTGSNTGMGLEAAAKFAQLGALKVILAVRDISKGEIAKSLIETRTGNKDQLEVWKLDMNSFDSVVAFAERAKALPHLDVVVLNAGVRKIAFIQSPEGWEETLQVNTLSSALLGILLLPKLKASNPSPGSGGKIPVLEFVNSGMHTSAIIKPSILASTDKGILEAYNEVENFNGGTAYGLSKLFLMFVAAHLAAGTNSANVIVTSMCPGAVKTDIARDFNFPGAGVILRVFFALFANSAEAGSRMIVSGTAAGEKAHGGFWQHDQVKPEAPTLVGEKNKEIGERVWKEIIGILADKVSEVKGVLEGLGR
ncbi:short-chain dehydrogenase/reductase family protein-like protein [Clohesyomyces aquaticus]|uniref:Short-chain dehydrogenase/reductase family protein-like protein n=1 Tax=Clohesyomyces aquaticus TaxID=1231657 RepID=A0A1Y1Z7G9_9PLEO|nr:short-chain dehydrogenase/reductase family protein-like protein [Clohesyomyces aquaticus]